MDYVIILASMTVALAIGSNDIANAIGTTIGSNALSYRRAILLAGAAVCLGALIGGSSTIDTMGNGIIDTSAIETRVLVVALLSSAFAVGIATYLSFPVSTTQSLVGALAGTGLAMGIGMNDSVVIEISVVWALLPLVSMSLSFALFFIFRFIFNRLLQDRAMLYETVIRGLVILSGLFVAFSLGTNNIGNVVGAIDANDAMNVNLAIVMGAIFITLGSLIFSKRVIMTIGRGITTLDPLRAFVSQFSSSIAVIICTYVGVPVSLSQAIVGGIVGVGLTKGRSSLDGHFILRIMGSWVLTPLISGSLMYVMYRFIL